MATAEQIKSLIRSYGSNDSEQFLTIALQVAAHEAMQGHTSLAHEIRELVDKKRIADKRQLKVINFPSDLKNLVLTIDPTHTKAELVLDDGAQERIQRIIHEYFQREKLKRHGLKHRRKILLVGPPGTGKTLTAKVLAHELHLPLHTVQVDRVVTKFMGETSAKLRQIFDFVQNELGVYFFDEFDAIGSERTLDNDVGEMRRVLNSFLQFIEQDTSDSLIIAATNNPQLLDQALFRRFDDVLEYHLPDSTERSKLINNVTAGFLPKKFGWTGPLKASEGLSHADIAHACLDAVKKVVLLDRDKIQSSDLIFAFDARKKPTTLKHK